MVGLRVGKHKPYCGTLFIGICTGFRLPIQQIGHLIAHTNRNMHRTGYRLRAIVEQPDLGLKGFAFEPCEFFNSRTEQLGTQRRFDKCVSWLRLCRIRMDWRWHWRCFRKRQLLYLRGWRGCRIGSPRRNFRHPLLEVECECAGQYALLPRSRHWSFLLGHRPVLRFRFLVA